MKLLETKILSCGKVYPGDILKVDSFVNHCIDVDLMNKLGQEFYARFKDEGVNKILTIEASGIGISCLTAQYFHVPVVFAKKSKSSNISAVVYKSQAHSYTHGNDNTVIVSREYLSSDDRILIIDDFLASGSALKALVDICNEAGAKVVGVGTLIEKTYQGGGDYLRSELGLKVESLAKIKSMTDDGKIEFCD